MKLEFFKLVKERETSNNEKDKLKINKEFNQNPFKKSIQLLKGEKNIDRIEPKFKASELQNAHIDIHKAMIYESPNWMKQKHSVQSKIEMNEITVEQIKKLLINKKSFSAPGPDSIPYIVWKKCVSTHKYIAALFNKINHVGIYPNAWKQANSILIYKKNEPDKPENFRPISLTSCLSKLYTSILSDASIKHMIDNKYLSDYQKAFLPKMSGCLEHHYTLERLMNDKKKKLLSFKLI